MGPYNNQPYDFNNPVVQAGIRNAFPNWDKVMALNNAYKAQFGTNITDAALFRNYNESMGNYMWGAPDSGTVPAGASVASTTAKNITDNGVYQNGTFTPNLGSEQQFPARANSVTGAPALDSYAPLGSNVRSIVSPGAVAAGTTPTSGTAGTPGSSNAGGNNTGLNGGGGLGTDLQQFAAGQAQQQQALIDKQNAEQEGLFKQFDTARQTQESLPAMYQRLRGELGIPQLQQTFGGVSSEITRTKDLLDRLDEDVTARSLGTLTTEAQRRAMIASEGDPLRTNIGRLGSGLEPIAQALSAAQGELSNQVQLGSQQQERELDPLKARISAVSDRFARELTGFTESKQTTLDALLDSIERQRYVSDRDWQTAQTLAAEEREFQRQKDLAATEYARSQEASTTDFNRQKELAAMNSAQQTALARMQLPSYAASTSSAPAVGSPTGGLNWSTWASPISTNNSSISTPNWMGNLVGNSTGGVKIGVSGGKAANILY